MGEEMEANTCYLGIELNDLYAMVSYMQPNMEEPETVSTIAGSENYRIPTLLARRKNVGMWYYGEDAGRMAKTSEVICVDSLLRRAAASEVITIAKESYDAVDLLALFIKKVIELPQKLGNTSHVTGIVLTVDHLTKELIGIFRHVAELLGLSQETFAVIDDKEIKQDDYMGIGDKGILSVGTDMEKTVLEMIGEMIDEDSAILSIYYGEEMNEDSANEIAEKVEEEYPDVEVEVHYGGQPIYYYVISVE